MMRLDKFLVETQITTRSMAKDLVKKGLITVNGQIVKKSDVKIDENNDVVTYNDVPIRYQKHFYVMLNKPMNVVSATQDNLHKTVLDLLPTQYHKCFPVGRLDKDTVGLLLLTTDGELAHNLLSPKKHVDKVYEVHLKQAITSDDVEQLHQGVVLNDGYRCLPAVFEPIDMHKGLMTIKEGKFHQVKRMFQAVGNTVVFLKRIKMGQLALDETLALGEFRELTAEEVEKLKSSNRIG